MLIRKLCIRNLFWLILAIPAIQMLLFAAGGCSFLFRAEGGPPEEAATEHNGYICECGYDVDEPIRDVVVKTTTDDAEESDGTVTSDIETLTFDTDTSVAVRFADFGVPRGSEITAARVRFTSDKNNSQGAVIDIYVENSKNAATFGPTNTINSRDLTTAKVSWVPGDWTRNTTERTPELKTVIQEVVARDDWSENSPLVLVFKTTGGPRVAKSFDTPGGSPVLELEYSERIALQLPVCLEDSVPIDGSTKAALIGDCGGRVQDTFRNLITANACGYVDATEKPKISCEVVAAYSDEESSDEEDLGFWSNSCEADCTGEPLDLDEPACSNFNAVEYATCRDDAFELCRVHGTLVPDCIVDQCAIYVAATHTGDDDPVCIAIGRDDVPQSMSRKILGRDSMCKVAGQTEITVLYEGDEREPRQRPVTLGILDINGEPCPGGTCPVGFASRLDMANITFAVKWKRDPKFEQLSLYGLATPSASVGGQVMDDVDSSVAVGRGQRGAKKAAFGNSDGANSLRIGVDWENRTCRLEGDLLTENFDAEGLEGVCTEDDTITCLEDSNCDTIVDDEVVPGICIQPEEVDPAQFSAVVDLQGYISNQPPTAMAGAPQILECTSPDGAEFTLNGGASSDPDGTDIRLVSWRQGDRLGPEIGTGLSVPGITIGVGEANDYVLRVIDSHFQSDEELTTVAVEDTTPPVISCNTPATITPPDAGDDKGHPGKKNPVPPPEPVMFTATADDICDDGLAQPTITAFDCFTFNKKGKRIDKTQGSKEACMVTFAGDTVTISDTGGVGDYITWTVESTDTSGNTSQSTCEVLVVNPS
jgi:hypothetical protein